ncbi:hypothetical protein [Sinorhizobium medicae]
MPAASVVRRRVSLPVALKLSVTVSLMLVAEVHSTVVSVTAPSRWVTAVCVRSRSPSLSASFSSFTVRPSALSILVPLAMTAPLLSVSVIVLKTDPSICVAAISAYS